MHMKIREALLRGSNEYRCLFFFFLFFFELSVFSSLYLSKDLECRTPCLSFTAKYPAPRTALGTKQGSK